MANPQRTNRPRRQRKGDRLLAPGASAEQIKCDYAIAPLDRMAIEYDRKWGIDRLPEIVSPETAQRYGAAMAHLNECIEASDPATVQAAAENCMRGLQAMDAEATASKKPTATGEFWEYELTGHDGNPPFKFAIMADPHEWQTSQASRPDLRFFTMREVAIALQAHANSPLIDAVKKNFPASEVVSIRPGRIPPGGDPIPF